MRALILILVLCTSKVLVAQQKNSLDASNRALTVSINLADSLLYNTIDTIKIPILTVDSLQKIVVHRSDSLNLPQISNEFAKKADSLKALVNDSLKRTSSYVKNKKDSLANLIQAPVRKLDRELASIQTGVQDRADTLSKRINSIVDEFQGRLNHSADSIQQQTAISFSTVMSKVEDKVSGTVVQEVNVSLGNELGMQKVAVPAMSVTPVDTKIDIQKVDIEKVIDIPQSDSFLGLPAKDFGELQEKIPEINELDRAQKLGSDLEAVKNLENLNEYAEELEKIKQEGAQDLEKIPDVVEEKIETIDQMQDFKQEIGKATAKQAEYEAMLQRYQDKKLLQEEIKRKAANVANEMLTKQSALVQKAQKDFIVIKRGFSGAKTVRGIFKRKSDELAGKKFYQRLVPGITSQVYNKDQLSVDFGAQIGYRFTPRFTSGLGIVYRLGFNEHNEYFVKNMGINGWRMYVDLNAVKGIFLHGEFELLTATIRPAIQHTNETPGNHIYGSYFGLGKRFNISRNVRGNFLGLYRIEYAGELPSMSKINVRIGFDYVWKKKKKKFTGLK